MKRQYRWIQPLALVAWTLVASGVATAAPETPTAAVKAALGEDATLDDYVRSAALRNPTLQAAYYEWTAVRERVPQERSLPDPRVSYSYYIRNVETFTGPQRHRIGAAQTFPWPGKRRLAAEIATHEAEAARQRYEAHKLQLVFRVAEAYAEYYHLGRAIDATRENVELLTYWENLARARYRVADGTYPDVINAQVELAQLDDRLRTLEGLRAPTVARLDELLDREERGPLPWPETLPLDLVVFDDDDLIATLDTDNPELKAETAQVAAAERAIALAKTRYFPDVTIGIEWIETGDRGGQNRSSTGEDPLIGTLSMNLPIWWAKYAAGVREAEARRLAASRVRRGRALDLAARLRRAIYRLRDAERKIDLYGNGLIPKGREALDANFTAYESDRADFLDLLDAQRLLLEFQLSYDRARADHVVRLAEIEMLIGNTLPREHTAAVPEGTS